SVALRWPGLAVPPPARAPPRTANPAEARRREPPRSANLRGTRARQRWITRILPRQRANVRTAAKTATRAVGRRENHAETVVAGRRGLRADDRRCAGDRR